MGTPWTHLPCDLKCLPQVCAPNVAAFSQPRHKIERNYKTSISKIQTIFFRMAGTEFHPVVALFSRWGVPDVEWEKWCRKLKYNQNSRR